MKEIFIKGIIKYCWIKTEFWSILETETVVKRIFRNLLNFSMIYRLSILLYIITSLSIYQKPLPPKPIPLLTLTLTFASIEQSSPNKPPLKHLNSVSSLNLLLHMSEGWKENYLFPLVTDCSKATMKASNYKTVRSKSRKRSVDKVYTGKGFYCDWV